MQKLVTMLCGSFVALSMSAAPLEFENSLPGEVSPTLIGKAGTPLKGERKKKVTPAPSRSEQTTVNVLIDEDFSLFTAGSKEEPDGEYLGVAGEPYIDDALTHQPGWSTNYATQAGGSCALNTPIGGFINTPIGDYSGKITISFRAKRLSPNPVTATMGVLLLFNDIWNPDALWMDYARIYDTEVNGEGELDEDGWKQFSYTYDNTYSSNDTFIQLSAYYCQVLIDDVRVTVEDTGDVAAPQVSPATDFTRDGFTAHWSDVRLADSYLFSLYHETQVSDPVSTVYDFNTPGDLEGWNLESNCATTDDKGFEGSHGLVIDSNNYLYSPEYAGRLESIKLWMRNIGDHPYSCSLKLQGYDGNDWQDIGSIYIEHVPFDSEGSTLVINGQNRPAFYDKYNKVRFELRGWESDAEEDLYPLLVVDHIEVTTLPGMERVYDKKSLAMNETEYLVDSMDPYTDYFYEVASVRGEKTSWSKPILAFGISTPVILAASEATGNSYTANWEPTPKASLYRVRDLGVYEAKESETDYPVLDEVFESLEGGTHDDPFFLGNDFEPRALDDYTTYPGWEGASIIIGDGMLGVGSSGYCYLRTPELTLDNGTGNFSVEVTVDMMFDDAILITPSAAQGEYIGFEAAEGENTVTLNYTGGSANETLRIKSQNGSPFYLKSIYVTQNLNYGDKVYTYLESHVIESDNESYAFKNVDFESYLTHAFDVMAIYNRGVSQCVSERSTYGEVKGEPVSVLPVKGESSFAVRAGEGTLTIQTSEAGAFTVSAIDGSEMARLHITRSQTVALPAGLYIVCNGSASRKVVVK